MVRRKWELELPADLHAQRETDLLEGTHDPVCLDGADPFHLADLCHALLRDLPSVLLPIILQALLEAFLEPELLDRRLVRLEELGGVEGDRRFRAGRGRLGFGRLGAAGLEPDLAEVELPESLRHALRQKAAGERCRELSVDGEGSFEQRYHKGVVEVQQTKAVLVAADEDGEADGHGVSGGGWGVSDSCEADKIYYHILPKNSSICMKIQ